TAGHGSAASDQFSDSESALGAELPDHARAGGRWTLTIGAALLILWLAPTALLLAMPGASAYRDIAIFFSKMAVVTFGGAYAVLAQRALAGALAGVTAAVVGVILNLACWFALHFLFARVTAQQIGALTIEVPDAASLDVIGLLLSAAAIVAVFRYKIGVLRLL